MQTWPTLTGAGLCHPAVPAEVDDSQGPPEKPCPLFMSPGWFSVLPHTEIRAQRLRVAYTKGFYSTLQSCLRQSQGWINSGQGPKVASTASIKMANLPWKPLQTLLSYRRPELGHVRTRTAWGEGIRPRMESSARDCPLWRRGRLPRAHRVTDAHHGSCRLRAVGRLLSQELTMAQHCQQLARPERSAPARW